MSWGYLRSGEGAMVERNRRAPPSREYGGEQSAVPVGSSLGKAPGVVDDPRGVIAGARRRVGGPCRGSDLDPAAGIIVAVAISGVLWGSLLALFIWWA